ncbi:MAG: hypothetical protein PF574_03590 [Candidatus Delongbacteria bacterium]|jgi:hypothetical protein|nr:hypothetical protein [Candidatus Delongbacteria bacterium]
MKPFIRTSILAIIIALFILGCCNVTESESDIQITIEQMYSNAISDAILAEESEIYDGLTAIIPSNPDLLWSPDSSQVLVISWTRYPDSYPVDSTITCWWGDTWVTAVPDLEKWVTNHAIDVNEPSLRFRQLLGLPPVSEHSHFVEFWASPEDLFRPAPDSEITDNICELAFSDSVDTEYVDWFNSNILYSYFPQRYPWTRLGYTYDWGSENTEIGLSEFVLRQDADIVVERVISTNEFVSLIK